MARKNISATSPRQWLSDIEEAIDNPDVAYLKYATQEIIPPILVDAYERFHNRAVAHARTRGEHEALMYMSFYVIHKYKLWRAQFQSWEAYCDEIDNSPGGVSKTSIKGKVFDIERALARGMNVENIVLALANVPYATRALLSAPQERVETDDGKGINEIVETIVELSPSEAGRHVADIIGEPRIACIDGMFDEVNGQILFKVRTRPGDMHSPTYERDFHIQGVEEPEASWILKRLGILGVYSAKVAKKTNV